ncbi:MAG: hypothetical protein JSR37_00340 [Verrucomicrobia bacterium]|nr:hypothetical protein [Verrucomicrobiota bacterium]MBS0636854.1 hypothetical protein [Verrucomicrobiota bacterium]
MYKRLIIFFVSVAACLQAAGWGAKDGSQTFEGVEWREVYYDMYGVTFSGKLPNYDGTEMINDEVFMNGFVDDTGYVIETYLSTFKPPKSGKDFKKIIQGANPSVNIGWLNPKTFGAVYAVEFMLQDDVPTYWRIFYANNRIFKLGTADSNQARRDHFFNSFRIK